LLIASCFLAETCAALREAPRADWLYRTLRPFGGQWVMWTDAICLGPIAYFLGLLARTMGRFDEGSRHFEDALASSERAGARPYVARTQLEYAVLLLERAAPGDAERARTLLAEARTIAGALGMAGVGARAAALLDAPGAHAVSSDGASPAHVFRRDGDYW